MSVSSVPLEQLGQVWAEVRPMVVRGLRHGGGDNTSEAEILQSIVGGRMVLWVVHEGPKVVGAIVLEISEREKGKALIVVLVAGKRFKECADIAQPLIEDYAALLGAYTIEAIARHGMARWLEELGWRKKATIMELKNGR